MRQFNNPSELLNPDVISKLSGDEWLCSECRCLNSAIRLTCEGCTKRRWEHLGLTPPQALELASKTRGG